MSSTTQLIASIEISVNGLNLSRISNISISQPFDNHHSFELSVTPDMLPEKSVKVDLQKLAEQVVGEAITITLKQGLKNKEGVFEEKQKRVFKGIVTSLRLSKGSSTANTLLITGVSPTAMLSAGRTTRSFTDKTLGDIVKKVLSSFGALPNKVQTAANDKIHYVTQYEEDNFHFLQRLAEDFGEWMFYDGQWSSITSAKVATGSATHGPRRGASPAIATLVPN